MAVNHKVVLTSNDSWRVKKDSFIVFNQLRSGEYFDARLYSPDWSVEILDETYPFAVIDKNPPQGEFLPYEGYPVREVSVLEPKKFFVKKDGGVVVDFGVNISGYVGIKTIGKNGDKIVIRHAEEIDENNNLKINGLDCFIKAPFQTNEIICGDSSVYCKPYFTYHGFRYVEIKGIVAPFERYEIKAYRTNNTAKGIGSFSSSDDFLNRLHDCSINSVQSNLQYNLTDCPTREKLGWTNDAAMSAEHIYYTFDISSFFKKWMRDISDTMNQDGALSGIAPSPDWGYGNGPVCDVAFFEIPYMNYVFTGDKSLLIKYVPYYKKYLGYLKNKEKEGHVFPLADWFGYDNTRTSKLFITSVLTLYFYKILEKAQKFAGEETAETSKEYDRRLNEIREKYIDEKGKCVENTQTAVAMMIAFRLYEKLEPLKEQLTLLIESNDYHLDVGLLGNKYIWTALDGCGLNDYALEIIKVKGKPGFDYWFSDGATSLYENWGKERSCSLNHHMFSAVNVFNYKILAGIRFIEPKNGEITVDIDPYFAENIDWVNCTVDAVCGKIAVKWKRNNQAEIELCVFVDGEQRVNYQGKTLHKGENRFTVRKEEGACVE